MSSKSEAISVFSNFAEPSNVKSAKFKTSFVNPEYPWNSNSDSENNIISSILGVFSSNNSCLSISGIDRTNSKNPAKTTNTVTDAVGLGII